MPDGAGGALSGCGVGVDAVPLKSRRWRYGDSITSGSELGGMLSKRQDVLEVTMSTEAIRSTLYLEPGLHQALRLKAATAHRSMSEIVNDAVRASLREDEEDLAAFSGRAKEKTMSYEQFLAKLKADGAL
jgi:plasmid stability protein